MPNLAEEQNLGIGTWTVALHTNNKQETLYFLIFFMESGKMFPV